jgi:hypothetical protein
MLIPQVTNKPGHSAYKFTYAYFTLRADPICLIALTKIGAATPERRKKAPAVDRESREGINRAPTCLIYIGIMFLVQ